MKRRLVRSLLLLALIVCSCSAPQPAPLEGSSQSSVSSQPPKSAKATAQPTSEKAPTTTQHDSVIKAPLALLAGGELQLSGQVQIDGLESFSGKLGEAAVHCRQVSWKGEAADQLVVDGIVTSQSEKAHWDTARVKVRQFTGKATAPDLPSLNIAGAVAAQKETSALTLVSGLTTVPEGSWFLKGPARLEGSLQFQQGAHLYVDGDFTCQGSITGHGYLYVNGNLSARGVSEISAANRVAIMASGNIHLQGYQGTQLFAQSKQGAESLTAMDQLLDELETLIAHPGATAPTLPELPEGIPLPPDFSDGIFGNWGALDRINHQLYNPDLPAIFDRSLRQGVLPELEALVQKMPESPQREMALARITGMGKFFWYLPDKSTKQAALKEFRPAPRTTLEGAVDAIFDEIDPEKPEDYALALMVRNVSRDHHSAWLGHAFFEGLLFAGQDIHLEKELIVHGCVIARGRVQIEDCRVTQLDDLFNEGPFALSLSE